MGMYRMVANFTQADRPVYQLVGSTISYLFYSASAGDWRINGDVFLSGSCFVKSTGNAEAACPDQATDWQTCTDGAWVSTYPITVVQTPPTTPSLATVGRRSCYILMRPV
jgi:hypothetical protein